MQFPFRLEPLGSRTMSLQRTANLFSIRSSGDLLLLNVFSSSFVRMETSDVQETDVNIKNNYFKSKNSSSDHIKLRVSYKKQQKYYCFWKSFSIDFLEEWKCTVSKKTLTRSFTTVKSWPIHGCDLPRLKHNYWPSCMSYHCHPLMIVRREGQSGL